MPAPIAMSNKGTLTAFSRLLIDVGLCLRRDVPTSWACKGCRGRAGNVSTCRFSGITPFRLLRPLRQAVRRGRTFKQIRKFTSRLLPEVKEHQPSL